MKRTATLLMVICLLPVASFAQGSGSISTSDVQQLLGGAEGSELPDALKPLLGDERINMRLEGSTQAVGVVTQDGTITSIQQGAVEDPTVNVFISERARELASQEGREGVQTALDEGEIRIQGVGIFNSIKFTMLTFLAGIFL